MKTLLLYGGGIDSTTVLAHLATLSAPGSLGAVWVNYGQVAHEHELLACQRFCELYGAELHVVTVSIPLGSSSAILDASSGQADRAKNVLDGRNAMLLSLATPIASAHGYSRLALGYHYESDKTFPDARPEFFVAYQQLLNVGMLKPIQLMAPFMNLQRAEIFAYADSLNTQILDEAHTCYAAVPGGCGVCTHCIQKASYVRTVPDDQTLISIRARLLN